MQIQSVSVDSDYLFVVKRLISILEAPVQFDPYLILYHPTYPGFLSIKDTLISMGFSVEAYHLSDPSHVDITTPSIIHLCMHESRNELVILKQITSRQVVLETFTEGTICLSLSDFLKKWDGNLMSVDYKSATAKSVDRLVYRIDSFIKFTSLSLLLSTLLSVLTSFIIVRFFPDWLFLMTTTLGCAVSIILLLKQFKLVHLEFLERLCENDKVSCRRVLNSDKSTAVLGVTWAEIGFTYFAGTLLAMGLFLIFGRGNVFNMISSCVSLFTIPIILYGLYLQYQVLKAWCMLCLFVHMLLVTNVVVSIGHISDPINISDFYWLPLYFSLFLAVGGALLLLKKIILLNSIILSHKERSAVFRSNLGYFDFVFRDQQIKEYKSIYTDMEWGTSDSKLVIIGILSLDCKYCYTVGRELNQLKEIFKEDLFLKIVFVSKFNDSLDPLLIEILLKSRNQDDLFNQWLLTENNGSRLSVPIETHFQRETLLSLLQKRDHWLVANEIKATPQVIINGSLVKQRFTPMDLLYYLRTKINYENEKESFVDVNTNGVHFSVS